MSDTPSGLTRRGFFAGGAALGLAAGATPLPVGSTTAATAAAAATAALPDADPAALRWLDSSAPPQHAGLAWGWPWARGSVPRGQDFALRDPAGRRHPVQSWPLAWWPDGSVKWSGHALAPGVLPQAGWAVEALPAGQAAALPAATIRIEEDAESITVDTGVIRCRVPRRGPVLVSSVTRGGVEILRTLRLIAQCDDQPGDSDAPRRTPYDGVVTQLDIEQRGPQRAVLRLRGQHRSASRTWLPFDLRLYLHAGGDAVRVMHSFVFDGDPRHDFLRGLGLRAEVPLRDPLHDRHLRLAGAASGPEQGLWAEAVRGLTGLRRDPGAAVRAAQGAGQASPPVEGFHPSIRKYLDRIPAWGDVSLLQLAPDAFQIRKRTHAGQAWVHAAWGRRAAGLGYVGGPSGGLAFGLRDFWQRHPTQLDIRDAHTEAATITVWMHSPEAAAMDLRPYHDGLGQDTFEKQLQGLEVTYEDYEPGFNTPVGVGRSSEITLFALAATPRREALLQLAGQVQTPPQLVAAPARYLQTRVFGPMWSLPDRTTPQKAAIEDRLDFLIDFYQREAEQRRWTGFWDYGDIRHTYDRDRHEWRYDVGGYAWDNSELSPDLWFWFAFLRSGRADIFRFAEAQVRHTTEVDTYHLGRFAGLGTRHGVQHWSDSAKQVRISSAAYRRHYHYLTADERIGDVLHTLAEADRTLMTLDPGRKLGARPQAVGDGVMGVGTDWGAMLANWLTEWERTGDERWRERIRRGMESVASMPHGFFSAATAGYELKTGRLIPVQGQRVAASHLSAVFGLTEMMGELIELIEVPGFERAWLQYCRLYNAPVEEQRRELGDKHGATNALTPGHSRLTAYAAWRTHDAALARRAWREFRAEPGFDRAPLRTERVAGAVALRPVEEAPWISTNAAAQWSLAAIQNLALVGDQIPQD